MTTRQFQPTKRVGSALSKAEKMAVQTIPKADATTRDKTGRQLHRQRPVPGARHIFAQLLFVRREDSDATPPARNGHIPLLRVGRGLYGGIRKQNIIHRLALRAVGRDSVAGEKLAETFVQDAAIGEFNYAIGPNRFCGDKFAIRDATT